MHWVWLHNSEVSQENILALVDGYKSRGIPVGAVNIDSTWATEFNNFVVNTNKFPDFAGMVKQLHDQDVKVILWATSMVNVENPDYQMAVDNNFLVRDSKGCSKIRYLPHPTSQTSSICLNYSLLSL